MNVYEYVFVGLRGASMPLSNYRGQPILFVNTASACGYTPQYAQLQRVWDGLNKSEQSELIAAYCRRGIELGDYTAVTEAIEK